MDGSYRRIDIDGRRTYCVAIGLTRAELLEAMCETALSVFPLLVANEDDVQLYDRLHHEMNAAFENPGDGKGLMYNLAMIGFLEVNRRYKASFNKGKR